MRQNELVTLITHYADMSEARSTQLLHLIVAILTASLQQGESAEVDGLGSFKAYWSPARKINPGGRGVQLVAGHWSVRFRASPKLLKALTRERKAPKTQLWDRPALKQ